MEFEYLYPGVAQQMLPHIDEVIHMHGMDPSEENIGRISDEVVRRSFMGSHNPPRGHNQSTLNDLARLLVLQRLIEQGRFHPGFPVFPYQPFVFFPPVHRPPSRPPHRR